MNSTETEEFSCNENSGTVINKNSKYEESVWEINYKIGTEKKEDSRRKYFRWQNKMLHKKHTGYFLKIV